MIMTVVAMVVCILLRLIKRYDIILFTGTKIADHPDFFRDYDQEILSDSVGMKKQIILANG